MKWIAWASDRDQGVQQLKQIGEWAKELSKRGYGLRLAGTAGDRPMEEARWKKKWKPTKDPSKEAKEIALNFYPSLNKLRKSVRDGLVQNVYIALGEDLKSPADMVICFSRAGMLKGRAGHLLQIARAYKIPYFNLHKEHDRQRLRDYLSGVRL